MKLSDLKEHVIKEFGKNGWEKIKGTIGYNVYISNEVVQKEIKNYIGKYIQHIHNPSEEEKCIAIYYDGNNIRFINNIDDELMKKAIIREPEAIQYIENPSEELQLLAVKEDPLTIQYIKNPTEKTLQEVLKGIKFYYDYPYMLRHLENDLKEE